MKSALITGITGQDGAYLAKLLLEKGYEVYGGIRRTSSGNRGRLVELGIDKDIEFVDFDLLELSNVMSTIEDVQPDEVYNLAAQSFVGLSFKQPIYTSDADALGALRILEAIRKINNHIKFYQASTSEMFGLVQEPIQTETTPFYPRSPYGVAKLFAHWITVNYRESYDIFAASGILFNHESPLRGAEFVTRKITLGLAGIKCGVLKTLQLGNMGARRDWGFAGDYVDGMWRMLQAKEPDTYILASGRTHSVEDFVTAAAKALDIALEFSGEGFDRVARDRKTGDVIVAVDPSLFRPAEVDVLLGSSEKAKKNLDWSPRMSFEQLVFEMAIADYARVKKNGLVY